MVLAYDGTSYHGWQRQRSVSTIVGELERSFKEVFNKDITIVGASRTDAGVHALGQVARFFLEDPLPERRMKFAWNNILPPAILIRTLTETSDAFHLKEGSFKKFISIISLKRDLYHFTHGMVIFRVSSIEKN